MQNGAGVFTQLVAVSGPGDYDVSFSDANGFIGTVSFLVTAPAATVTATAPPVTAATPRTTRPTQTVPTPWPTTTKSPLPPLTVFGALGLAGIIALRRSRRG